MEDEIQHFSHKHHLRLKNKRSYGFNAKCAACWDDLSGVVYCCNDCRYYLHEECAKLEGKIEHSLHPFHSLKLHGIAGDGPFYCNVCQKHYLGFSYRCTDCNFKVDLLCSLKSEIRLPIHDHKLKLQVGDTETEPSFFCDFCHTRCYSHRGRSLHCEEDCNFKIDLDCAGMLMNSTSKPIQHVSHEHWLIYDDCIKARDRKYCAACRKVCDGATYCCKPCYFFLHVSCAMYPTEIKLSLHSDHPLMLSTRKERERCDFCNLICQALTFRCDLCDFKIDFLCARMLINLKEIYLPSILTDGTANCYACREQLSSRPFQSYECSDCAFYLHESGDLDLIGHYRHYKHIQNHFHNHPLEIVYYGRNVPGFVCCTLCRKCCFGPTYVCFLCKLFLHESCLELLGTNTSSQNSFHKHPLMIVENKVNDSTSYFFMNNDYPSCSACGEPCFEKSFACLKCKLLIHKLCLQLPHEIQHFFHPCPLSLRQESTKFTCRACKKSHSQFAYCCNRCHFFLDVECALMFTRNFDGQNYILGCYHHHPLILCNKESNDHAVSCDGCNQVISGEIFGCIQCHFYLHRSCAAAPQQIEHPFHPEHTLTLFFDEKLLCTVSILKSLDKKGKVKYLGYKHFSIRDDKEIEVCCGVCEKHVCGPSYECTRCKFFIHQDCIEPVEEGQHPFQPHDNDSLISVSRKTLPRKKFTCDACNRKSCFGFSYRCEECCFKLDANCASLKPPIKYEGHQHLLTFFEKVYDDPQCEVCNTCYSDVSYLRCVKCDFNVHLLCVPLPSTIKHKCHIDPLHLVDYFVEDYSGEYYCDACENSRDPRESVYHCAGCSNYVAHINCVIDEVLLSLRGKRGDVELRIVDRHNIDEKISKRGLTLKEIFNSSNEDEKREFEDAEAAIVDLVGEIMSKADSGNRDSILEDLVNSDETFILILKNLKYPMREEDISNLKFSEFELELVKVRNYMVSQNCAHILESLFVKYRDFCASSTSDETFIPMLKKDISRMTFLGLVSELVKVRDYMVSQNCAHILEPLFVKYRDICAISTSDEIFIPILKKINHPMREDILNMTFLELESEVVEVRDYMVSRNCAHILESLFDKYGDISASSTSNPRTKMRVLNIVGGVAQSMCNTMVKDITPYLLFNWWKNFQLAQHVGFNVQFAFDHLYRLAQAQFHMDCEFEANWDLYISQKKIEDLPTKLEVLKNKQKQLIQSIKKKSILEKERLTQVMESRFMPAGMGLL
uniref:Phorbol-ester/DAG-type domain-containing protein n=1 Tax=Quercus lobata TaxID=97700 RepID=A0A7N2LGK8_QUELO